LKSGRSAECPWYKLYQPQDFRLIDNCSGNKQEFVAMLSDYRSNNQEMRVDDLTGPLAEAVLPWWRGAFTTSCEFQGAFHDATSSNADGGCDVHHLAVQRHGLQLPEGGGRSRPDDSHSSRIDLGLGSGAAGEAPRRAG